MSELSLVNLYYLDFSVRGQVGFQDAATSLMHGIINLHHHIFFFIVIIVIFVFVIFYKTYNFSVWKFNKITSWINTRIYHQLISIIYIHWLHILFYAIFNSIVRLIFLSLIFYLGGNGYFLDYYFVYFISLRGWAPCWTNNSTIDYFCNFLAWFTGFTPFLSSLFTLAPFLIKNSQVSGVFSHHLLAICTEQLR